MGVIALSWDGEACVQVGWFCLPAFEMSGQGGGVGFFFGYAFGVSPWLPFPQVGQVNAVGYFVFPLNGNAWNCASPDGVPDGEVCDSFDFSGLWEGECLGGT